MQRVDYTATSRRPEWHDLPDGVRALIERTAGGAVRSAEPSVGSGFTAGFAAVLNLHDDTRVFAKAASTRNPHILEAYAREATVLAALPDDVPAPRLLGRGHHARGECPGDAEHAWQVIVVEAIEGRLPLPWTEADLDAVHEACRRTAAALTPPPTALVEAELLISMVEDLIGTERLDTVYPRLASGDLALTAGQPAWLPDHLDELAALTALAETALAGDTATHGDLRADNLLIRPDGSAVLVDWNWLSIGAGWTDFVGVLPLARADGLDADAWLARSPLTRHVEDDHLDCWLAVVAAFMLAHAEDPLFPGGTAVIREHRRWYARTFLDWLAARRGWA